METIGWCLLTGVVTFLLGLFIGERWSVWNRRSLDRYDTQDERQADDDYLQAVYKQIGGKPAFHKREAD